jgi:hypothetical protein
MATASIELITALRNTAKRLRNGAFYSWGHHGACNCGNLLQTITTLTEGQILRFAHTAVGEWTELAQEFCPVTNAPVNMVVNQLEKIGLTATDIHHVEYLSDKEVLQHLEGGFRWLKRNVKEDAIAYFEAFATMLEEKLSATIHINTADLFAIHQQTKQSQLQLV